MATVQSTPKVITELTVTGDTSLNDTVAHIKTLGVSSDTTGSAENSVTITRDALDTSMSDVFFMSVFKFEADGGTAVTLSVDGNTIATFTPVSGKVYVVETKMWTDAISSELKAITQVMNITDDSISVKYGELSASETTALSSSSFDVTLTGTSLDDGEDHFGAVIFG